MFHYEGLSNKEDRMAVQQVEASGKEKRLPWTPPSLERLVAGGAENTGSGSRNDGLAPAYS
jgi:hypothetical protein